MGKVKKTNADKTQQGSNRWAGPMQSSVFFSLFVFFPFSPLIGHQKNEKGSGRYRRRRERKREKRKKNKKERGVGRRKKSVNFCFFFFFSLSVVWYSRK